MQGLLKHTVRTAFEVGLVDLAIQAVDGTKIAANAARDLTYDARELERLLGFVRPRNKRRYRPFEFVALKSFLGNL